VVDNTDVEHRLSRFREPETTVEYGLFFSRNAMPDRRHYINDELVSPQFMAVSIKCSGTLATENETFEDVYGTGMGSVPSPVSA